MAYCLLIIVHLFWGKLIRQKLAKLIIPYPYRPFCLSQLDVGGQVQDYG
jgi:hypothetical protein